MIRSVLTASLTATCILAVNSDVVRAQGTVESWNPAITETTVDPASLGPARASFLLGYSRASIGSPSWTLGVGLGGGTARVLYGKGYRSTLVGAGYSRLVAARSAGLLGTFGLGFDLYGAYETSQPDRSASRAAELTIPLSLRWGAPGRISLTPYIGPYAQLGRRAYYDVSCPPTDFCTASIAGLQSTRSTGLAMGLDLDLWRVGLQLGVRYPSSNDFSQTYKLGIGTRFGF